MAKKMRKKTRNVLSGLLVGVASIFAVINFADVPAADVRDFLLSTAVFFVSIVALALVAVSIFKLLGWLGRLVFSHKDEPEDFSTDQSDKREDYGEGNKPNR